MPASIPEGIGPGHGDTSLALSELLRSTKQAEFEALYGHYCATVPEEALIEVPGYPEPVDAPSAIAGLGPLDTASLRSSSRNSQGPDGAKLSGRHRLGTNSSRQAQAPRSPGPAPVPSSGSNANGNLSARGGVSPGASMRLAGLGDSKAQPPPRSAGGTEIRRLHAELAAWGDELQRREREIKGSENPESYEELKRLRNEVAMQAEQLRSIVELLRRGLREADVSKLVPRLLEADEEAEEDMTLNGGEPPNISWPLSPPQVDAKSRPGAGSPATTSKLSKGPTASSSENCRGSRGATLASTLSEIKKRQNSPVSTAISSQQMQGLRSSVPRSPQQRPRPRSPRPLSSEKNSACEASSPGYYRGSSQSRSNLRTISPEASLQALQQPPVRANPPSSPAHLMSSRRTLPARMAGVPTAWFSPTSASASTSTAPGPARIRPSGNGAGSVQLAAGGGHAPGMSRPSASSAPQASPAHQGRTSSSSPPPHTGFRSTGATPLGRPNAAGGAATSMAAAANVAVATAPGTDGTQRTSLRAVPPWQVLSASPPAIAPTSPGPASDRRSLSSTWAPVSAPPMVAPLMKVRADYTTMNRQTVPQQAPF